ncbi:SDR family NAD(P)-dependent oxidoreductase [Rhodococcus koreensis]|uniref:SDR family NAD(P)-dependent oxidoreductase n=1 Tax=Rhodococcus koreensis TaxID=99653 RepID=UPI00366AD35C
MPRRNAVGIARWHELSQDAPSRRDVRVFVSSVEFDGKVALVTGAGSGTGAATALLLAERGAAVTVVGRRQSKTDEVAAQITSKGGRALAIAGDVSIAHNLESAVRATVDAFGALHFGVNNAGATGIFAPTAEMTEKDWRRVVGTNLDGLFFGMKYEIPAILAAGGGAIVNVSSVFADRGDRRSTTRPPSMRSAGLPIPQQKNMAHWEFGSTDFSQASSTLR